MGKSTLLKIMAGMEEVSNGDARLTPGYSVGILEQEPPLDETKNVYENVEADWNAEALGSAESYIKTMAVSKAKLYDQLTSDYGAKFTAEEYASLQYLRPYKDAKEDSFIDTDTIPWSFSYAMQVDSTGNPVDTRTLTVPCTEKSVFERDLQAFPGLVRIDLDSDGSFEWDAHSYEPNLKNLTALRYLNLSARSSFRIGKICHPQSEQSGGIGECGCYL